MIIFFIFLTLVCELPIKLEIVTDELLDRDSLSSILNFLVLMEKYLRIKKTGSKNIKVPNAF